MSQKIYTDRTELEGVDLPSAGQTRMLVIDENKKIKSEAKPTIPTKTSELENDSGFITSLVLFNQNPLDEVTVTGTTSFTTLLDISSGTITLSESDLEVGKTYEFQIYGNYTSTGDDFKFRFGLGETYVEVVIEVSGTANNLPFRITGSLDIVAVAGNPNARQYYFTGTVIRERSTTVIYEYPIMGHETVDDVTLGADFIFDVAPTDNSSSFTCYKAILKRLN